MVTTRLPYCFAGARDMRSSEGRSWIILLTILVLGVFATSNAPAQVYSGSLTGVAMDPSGGVVPGAKVSLTDEPTGFNFATLTDSSADSAHPALSSL